MIINLINTLDHNISSADELVRRIKELGIDPEIDIDGNFARIVLTKEDEMYLTLTYGDRFHIKDII